MTPSRPPCALPDLPKPAKFVGYPSDDATKIYVSKSDVASLAAYIVGLQAFVVAATACLEADR